MNSTAPAFLPCSHGLARLQHEARTLRSHRQARQRGPVERLQLAHAPQCWYCSLPAEMISWLVSERTGGTKERANRISVCRKCHAGAVDTDPLLWAIEIGRPLTQAQLGARREALAVASCHALNGARARSLDEARARYQQRWAWPRVALSVQAGEGGRWVAVLSKAGRSGLRLVGETGGTASEIGGQAVGEILSSKGATTIATSGAEQVLWISDAGWSRALPAIIDRHAILTGCEVPLFPSLSAAWRMRPSVLV